MDWGNIAVREMISTPVSHWSMAKLFHVLNAEILHDWWKTEWGGKTGSGATWRERYRRVWTRKDNFMLLTVGRHHWIVFVTVAWSMCFTGVDLKKAGCDCTDWALCSWKGPIQPRSLQPPKLDTVFHSINPIYIRYTQAHMCACTYTQFSLCGATQWTDNVLAFLA